MPSLRFCTSTTTVVIQVPPQPALVAVQAFFQAAVLSPTTPGGLSLSAALRIVVGE